jgi:hypothetical protein
MCSTPGGVHAILFKSTGGIAVSKAFVVCLIALFSFVSLSCSSQKEEPRRNSTLRARSQRNRDWNRNLRSVVRMTRDELARELLDYATERAVLGEPAPDPDFVKMIGSPLGVLVKPIVVIPVLPEDKEVSKGWNEIVIDPQAYGMCHRGATQDVLFVLDMKFADGPSGVIACHELWHIKHPKSGGAWKDFCEDELDAKAVDIRLFRKLGKDRYEKMAKTLLDDALQRAASVDDVDVEGYPTELNLIFGTPKSDEDKGYRETVLWSDICDRYMDAKKMSREQKIEFYVRWMRGSKSYKKYFAGQ